jgi:molybdenum cofactor cytidylyltransferase
VRFQGTLTIKATRPRVWRFLTDPERLARCAPALEALEILAPQEGFRATLPVLMGAVRVPLVIGVHWLDLLPPGHARMKVRGTAPGIAVAAESEVRLQDAAEGTTEIHWSVDVGVVETLPEPGPRLMEGVTQTVTSAFFDELRRKVEAERSFRFGPVPIEETEGKILGHNLADADGIRVLRKGRRLTAEDVLLLRSLGRRRIYVAEPGTRDVGENEAALRLAQAALGSGLRLTGPHAGRTNLVATGLGLLRVDVARLLRLNHADGVTIATRMGHTPVQAGEVVATIKVIPYALPEETLTSAEATAREGGPWLHVDPLPARFVSLLLSGSPGGRDRVVASFEPPLRARVEALGSTLRRVEYLSLGDEAGEAAVAAALRREVDAGTGLILLAGETAIVDRHDIAPRAVEQAGGEVTAFGIPVDPGNLLMLAWLDSVPVLGAPGCARSPRGNVIDLVLPRLLAGDRLSREDLVPLGHGGLLEDVPERGAPRDPPSETGR